MKGDLCFIRDSPVLPLIKSPSIPVPKVSPKCRRINAELEVRVCLNKVCRRQGSMETLEILSGIAPPHVTIKSCGCLGRCGAGPNIVALPGPVVVGHCGTAARAAQVIIDLCGGVDDGDSSVHSNSLAALALRKKAENELQMGNFSEAEHLLSQAMHLKPYGGVHIIYKVRSLTRLAMGNHSGALEDAKEALMLAPRYLEAYICQGDAFFAMDQFDAAEKAYLTSLQIDPSIRRSKSFKVRISKLQEKLAALDSSKL